MQDCPGTLTLQAGTSATVKSELETLADSVAEALGDRRRRIVRRQVPIETKWAPLSLEAQRDDFQAAEKRVQNWDDFEEEDPSGDDGFAWVLRNYRREVRTVAGSIQKLRRSSDPTPVDWACDWETLNTWSSIITPFRYRAGVVYLITPPEGFGRADDPPAVTRMSVRRFIAEATSSAAYEALRAARLEAELQKTQSRYYLASGLLISVVLMVLFMLFA